MHKLKRQVGGNPLTCLFPKRSNLSLVCPNRHHAFEHPARLFQIRHHLNLNSVNHGVQKGRQPEGASVRPLE